MKRTRGIGDSGSEVTQLIADTPHKTVLGLLEMDSKVVSTAFQFPGTRRELLDKLQTRIVAFQDRIEVKALFPIISIYGQKCTSP